jgi:hypothetical protein
MWLPRTVMNLSAALENPDIDLLGEKILAEFFCVLIKIYVPIVLPEKKSTVYIRSVCLVGINSKSNTIF